MLMMTWSCFSNRNIGDVTYGGLTVVPLHVSIKDRSLTALLSCWTHGPRLAGRISLSDHEAWTLSGPGVEPPCAVLVIVEENDEGATRNLGIPWIPRSPERSSGVTEPPNLYKFKHDCPRLTRWHAHTLTYINPVVCRVSRRTSVN